MSCPHEVIVMSTGRCRACDSLVDDLPLVANPTAPNAGADERYEPSGVYAENLRDFLGGLKDENTRIAIVCRGRIYPVLTYRAHEGNVILCADGAGQTAPASDQTYLDGIVCAARNIVREAQLHPRDGWSLDQKRIDGMRAALSSGKSSYSHDELLAWGRAARKAAIEECAKVCEQKARDMVAEHHGAYSIAYTCAARIRDLLKGGAA